MQRALSFDSSPPLKAPLPFLISTVLFVLLAALVLLWSGPTTLDSRWNGNILALTHLFTIGVLANVMVGALIQILPVATNIKVLATTLTARVVHICISLGALLLAVAFLRVSTFLFGASAIILTIGFLWFAIACIGGMVRYKKQASKGSPAILLAVRLAVISLVITILFGLTLAGSMALALPLPRHLTDLHVGWGLLGWIGLLIAGISFQVIPMFQVTELFPKKITRWLALGIFIALGIITANSLYSWSAQQEASLFIALTILVGYLLYAATTFELLRKRKRPEPDTTTILWRMALICLMAIVPVWLLHIAQIADFSVLLGVLFIVGFAWSAVNGMLYKIIPFLLWYNTQRNLMVALRVVPKVRHFIPDSHARPQAYVHGVALLLLVMATIRPVWFTHAAAAALALSSAWLLVNILRALKLYLDAKQKIATELAKMQTDSNNSQI